MARLRHDVVEGQGYGSIDARRHHETCARVQKTTGSCGTCTASNTASCVRDDPRTGLMMPPRLSLDPNGAPQTRSASGAQQCGGIHARRDEEVTSPVPMSDSSQDRLAETIVWATAILPAPVRSRCGRARGVRCRKRPLPPACSPPGPLPGAATAEIPQRLGALYRRRETLVGLGSLLARLWQVPVCSYVWTSIET
jgi:hypothetical protein